MKKHPKLKSAMATLLAVCMLATFPACSGDSSGGSSSTSEGGSSSTTETSTTTDEGSDSSYDLSNLNEPGTVPVLKETVPLSVLFVQDTNIEDMETNDYLNKLCSEGLLDPLSFTQKQTEFKQVIENEEIQILGSMCAGSMSAYQVESVRKQDMTHMAPLTGPDGVCWTSYRNTSIPDHFGFITKDCTDPVAAFALFDYMYTEDMTMQGRYGTKDVDWKEAEEGTTGMYADMGWDARFEYINSIWGTLQNHEWGENHPTLRTYEMSGGQVWNGDEYDSQYMTAKAVPDYVGKIPDEIIYRLNYTQEEADSIAEFQANRRHPAQ